MYFDNQIYYYCPISAQANKKIHIDMPSYTHILASFANIEAQNRKILNYGWINFPLAYVQVATMSVFLYFLVALFGRQYLIPCEGMYVLNQRLSRFVTLYVNFRKVA